MSCDDTGTHGVQQFEVFTGAGRRRDWPLEVKVGHGVGECSRAPSWPGPFATVHLTSQLREQMEEHGFMVPEAAKPEPTFVPAVIDAMPEPDPAPQNKPVRRRRRSKASTVELEVDGITVKIARGADAGTISAVITALREMR